MARGIESLDLKVNVTRLIPLCFPLQLSVQSPLNVGLELGSLVTCWELQNLLDLGGGGLELLGGGDDGWPEQLILEQMQTIKQLEVIGNRFYAQGFDSSSFRKQ